MRTTAMLSVVELKPTTKTVRNAEGQYLGAYTIGNLEWVGPAHAYCFPVEKVEAIATQWGGTSAPVPRWDSKARAWK